MGVVGLYKYQFVPIVELLYTKIIDLTLFIRSFQFWTEIFILARILKSSWNGPKPAGIWSGTEQWPTPFGHYFGHSSRNETNFKILDLIPIRCALNTQWPTLSGHYTFADVLRLEIWGWAPRLCPNIHPMWLNLARISHLRPNSRIPRSR